MIKKSKIIKMRIVFLKININKYHITYKLLITSLIYNLYNNLKIVRKFNLHN